MQTGSALSSAVLAAASVVASAVAVAASFPE